MRPKTLGGALAKLEFYRWYDDEGQSEGIARDGLDAAIADLRAIVGA